MANERKDSVNQQAESAGQAGVSGAPRYQGSATVQIFLNESGQLDVDQKPVHMKPAGRLTFRIRGGESLTSFVILMKDETPFGSGERWVGGERGPGVKVRLDGLANGKQPKDQKRYSYSVMASDGTKTYHMDPDIVVGPRT